MRRTLFTMSFSFDLSALSLQPLITLLALVNPLASIPIFIHLTSGFSDLERKRTIRSASLAVFVILVVCALLGLRILSFFGISLASFQVAGGILLIMSALSMLNAQPVKSKTNVEETSYAANQASIAVIPLAIPMLTGPASMSTMVIFANRTQNWLEMFVLLLYAALVAAAVYLGYSTAPHIARIMGRTGINVMTRLMGLVLASMSVEVISEGLKKMFPAILG